MTHVIFHFARVSGQWKIYCYCFCDHCCSPVLERRGMTVRTRNGINEVQNTREFYHNLKYEWTTRLHFLQVGVQSFHDVLETHISTITQTNNNMREIVTPSRRLSILLSWLLETLWRSEIFFLGNFIVHQTEGKWMVIAQYCPRAIQYLRHCTVNIRDQLTANTRIFVKLSIAKPDAQ